jgi:hypothetical protein
VVETEQQAGTHKTTGTATIDYKETRKLQHTNRTSRRRPIVGNFKKFKKF